MNQPHSESHSSLPESFPLSRLPELSPTRQASADHYLKQANQCYNNYLIHAQRKALELAIDHYRQALEINPSLPEAYVKLASALWDQGGLSLDTAVDYCDTALMLDADYAEAYLFKGYFLRFAGKLDEAAIQFRMAITKTGKASPAKARLALGRTFIQKAAASRHQSSVKRIDYVSRGLGNFLLGCYLLPTDQQAFQALQAAFSADIQIFFITLLGRGLRMLRCFRQVTALYEWASRHMAEEPLFFHLLGDLEAENQNVDGAIYYYARAQELDPDNILLHKKLGAAYNQRDDKENAIKSLEKVVSADAADFDTLYSLAHLYTDRTEYMRALYYYKELIRMEPKNPYAYSNMAYVLFKLEDYDGAVQEYENAVHYGEDPLWTSTVAQTLGTIYMQIRQDLEGAEKMFQLAYQLDNSNLECLIMLGDIYTEQGNFEAAVRTYRYLLNMEPDNADCHNYMGYLLWQLDKNDDAVTSYRKSIELNPDNPIAFNNLGVIFLDEKCQLPSALDMFEQAVALKPDYTLACFNAARTREAMGQIADAAKGYTAALDMNKVNPELSDAEIQERLSRLFDV